MQQSELFQIAEIEITYKRAQSLENLPTINSSKAAADIFMQSWNMNQIEYREEFKILLLNRPLKPLGIVNISSGGLDATCVDIRLILAAALKANAAVMIAAHNHPSGATKPSRNDEVITKRIVQAGALLNIPLEDHLIITRHAFFSFSDNGLL